MDLDVTDRIRLSVPAATSAVRIARAGAAGLATRAGFTYQEVEQVQLAVAEAAGLLAREADGHGALVVTFDVEPTRLTIDLVLADPPDGGTTAAASTSAAVRDVPELAATVLDAAVDEWHVEPGGRRIVLHKRLEDIDLD